MFEPSPQAVPGIGVELKIASVQAFWIVLRREGSVLGITRRVLPRFAWPCVEETLTMKLTPPFLLNLLLALTVSFGSNGRLAQLATPKGEPTALSAPSQPLSE